MPGPITVFQATFALNASLSNELDLNGYQIVGIQMPASWDAADLSFQARPPGHGGANTTLQDVYDSADAELVIQAAAARFVVVTGTAMDALMGLPYVKFRSGTTGAPVPVSAARTLDVVVMPLT